MNLPEFFTFKGTANKSDWWIITIFTSIIEAFTLAGGIFAASKTSPPLSYLALAAAVVILILSLWATFAVAARRFRDMGSSPWFSFLYFIPYFGWLLVWIPCGFLPLKFKKRKRTRIRTVSSSTSSEESR